MKVMSFTARIEPTSRAALPVLATVRDALYKFEHVKIADNQILVELVELGSVLVTDLPGQLLLNFAGQAEPDGDVPAREIISQQLRLATGGRAAAAKLMITWAEEHPAPTPLRAR